MGLSTDVLIIIPSRTALSALPPSCAHTPYRAPATTHSRTTAPAPLGRTLRDRPVRPAPGHADAARMTARVSCQRVLRRLGDPVPPRLLFGRGPTGPRRFSS
jgi:hypothetical protein